MKNDRPPASPLGSGEHSPFKHLINTPNHVNENQVGEKLQEQKQKSGQNWFARISDEKRAESNTISYAEWALVPLCHVITLCRGTLLTPNAKATLFYVCSYICREGFHVPGKLSLSHCIWPPIVCCL
ncbi:hypothetical protein ZWY2020_036719, partial [Hordeum vulgare]